MIENLDFPPFVGLKIENISSLEASIETLVQLEYSAISFKYLLINVPFVVIPEDISFRPKYLIKSPNAGCAKGSPPYKNNTFYIHIFKFSSYFQ